MVEEFFNKIDSFYNQLVLEVSNMDIMNFIIIALMFYVPFKISKRVSSTFLRVLFFCVGVYMLYKSNDIRILYDTKMLVGLGLLLPQIRFIYFLAKEIIFTIKMMMANTYYFFITIYYKILRFFNWIGEIFFFIKMIFGKEEKQDTHNSRHNSSNDNSSYSNYKEQRSYEDTNSSNYEYKESNHNSYNSNDSYSSNNYENSNYEEIQDVPSELKQFYSPSAYVILGVNQGDDFKTIKKAYIVLVNIYHPDKNLDDVELYTEITQNINEAFDKLKKIHT